MQPIIERVQVAYKWLLSFTKSDWAFEDYPVRVRRNLVDDPKIGWAAMFLNWPGIAGLGPTPAHAKADLRARFLELRRLRHEAGESIPRPGRNEPIRFAPSVRVQRSPQLLDDFLLRVLGFEPDAPIFVSDQSSLHDFCSAEAQVEHYRQLIRTVYDVETSDLPDANLADILERIQALRSARGQ
jgi:hypothetical protein